MKSRLSALLLVFALLLPVWAQAAAPALPEASRPDAFFAVYAAGDPLLPRVRAYAGEFSDVSPESWYYPYVVSGYEYGLFNGRGGRFDPDAPITVAELIALSARLRASYADETIDPSPLPGEAWYGPYVEYLASHGILETSIRSRDEAATRAQLAAIFALSLPEACYDGRNDALVTSAVDSGRYITDVDARTPYRAQILWMYRQGLLSGVDASGSYHPGDTTTRAETAAVVMRMAVPALRVTPDWQVSPARSAAGRTLESLVEPPDAVDDAPSPSDRDAVDALVRRMLAAGERQILLRYPEPISKSDAQALAAAFSSQVKTYCEQMYNRVECQYSLSDGQVTLRFSSTACTSSQLTGRRSETMARAAAVHDELWANGHLREGMSQYEIAKVYFAWLCEHCAYDDSGADDRSASHLAWSALVLGKAVCDGYTGAYNLLLKLEGISCRAQANESHIWTVAVLDGTEYRIDATWGDQGSRIDWTWFGMTVF